MRTSNSQAHFRRKPQLLVAAFLAAGMSFGGPGESRAERPFPGPNGAIIYLNAGQIYRIDADGTDNVPLTPSGLGDYGPVWSPDGTRIAFGRCFTTGGCRAHIWVMNADGSGAHGVSNGAGDGNATDTDPVWSPDGTRIAYTSGRNFFELRMVNADGSQDHKLTGGETQGVSRIGGVTFSPDGRKILFERQVASTGGTWVINSNGKDAHQVPNVGSRPSWSPDGTQIAYEAGVEHDIWLAAADGSGATNLTETSNSIEVSPHFSPDGSSILFNRINNSFTEEDAILYHIVSGLEDNLTNTPALMDGAFSWSPDGQNIVGGNALGDLFVMDQDGGNVAPLHAGSAPDWQRLCTINGTDASEPITGTSDSDVICAGGGNDVIDAGEGDDVVFGGGGDDRILDGGGSDILSGQAGNDTIFPGLGDDTIVGDAGIDSVSFSHASLGIVASLASGVATGDGTDWIFSVENLIGSTHGDSLTGSRKNNMLSGGAGSDHLYGGDGADYLKGGDGRDTLRGEFGNDKLNGGPKRDICVQGPGAGARIACEA
jgi:Tol biopolymer transport system component